MQQSSTTPSLHLCFWRLRKIVACSQSSSQCLLVLTVFGMVSSLHSTSFLMIFTLVYLCIFHDNLLMTASGHKTPRHAVYIYMYIFSTDDKLLNLDPHYCQMAVNVTNSEFDIHTYHCRTPRKFAATKMDPSCTIGFFCKEREDFQLLRRKTEPVSRYFVTHMTLQWGEAYSSHNWHNIYHAYYSAVYSACRLSSGRAIHV